MHVIDDEDEDERQSLIAGLSIMPFSTPQIVAIVRYSPSGSDAPAPAERWGEAGILGDRPAVGRGVEHRARGFELPAAGLDRESGHGRVGGHRVDLAGG